MSGKRTKTTHSHGWANCRTRRRSTTDLAHSENWQSGDANRKRGRDWLDQIYKANHKSTENTLAAHQDFCKGIGHEAPSHECALTTTRSLVIHRNHLWSLPLRSQHLRRRRHRARRVKRHHDPESAARDRLAPQRNPSHRCQLRRCRDHSAMRESFACTINQLQLTCYREDRESSNILRLATHQSSASEGHRA